MKLKHELTSFHSQTINYTDKMIHHLLHGPSLTEEKFMNERLFCMSDDGFTPIKTTFWHQFYYETSLNGQKFKWSLTITPYEICSRIYPKFREIKEYTELLNEPKQLYSFYEFLYNEPSVRLKILSEFGPKIPFEEFNKRHSATKYWK